MRAELPIDEFLPRITAAARSSRKLVLVAPPGAGKTTRVPPAILAGKLCGADHPAVVMLQPRRVAARASAARIAEENGWTLGHEVGYHVRFDRKIGPDTRIRVLTEGILVRQLIDDPFLDGVGCVILDEFHERSLYTDLTLALLREVQQTVREDLILIVMSATLEAEPVASYLGDAPIVRSAGRTHPIAITYAEATTPGAGRLEDQVADALDEVLKDSRDTAGDVLVFLPGAEEIRRTARRLESAASRRELLVLPLFGALPLEDQNRALRPAKQQKVILATNIAETSLTIDGVRTVIDAGLSRVARYDAQRGLDRLDLERISKASATQRAGRAGRTAPGKVIRLWSQREHERLTAFNEPEVRRVDLAGTVLQLHAWGKPDPRTFGWYEAPPEESLAAAEELLSMLGAIDGGGITALGGRMLGMPVHPRLGRLLVDAQDQRLAADGAAIAALLGEKDIVLPAYTDRNAIASNQSTGVSDVLSRLDLLRQVERDRFTMTWLDRGVDPVAARQVARTRDDLLRSMRQSNASANATANASGNATPNTPGASAPDSSKAEMHPALKGSASLPPSEEQFLRLVLDAYPDRVCRRRAGDPQSAAIVGGGGVRLGGESVVKTAEFFVAVDARHDPRSPTREALVRVASAIELDWLPEMFPASMRHERAPVYDEQKRRVVGRLAIWYRDLLVREEKNVAVDPEAAADVLAAALAPRVHELLAKNESAANVLARVDLLRRAMPEHPWPTWDDKELIEVLREACAGKRSPDEVESAQLASLLLNRLPYPLDRLLSEHAPETVAVPTGNRIKLDYAMNAAPVLAVRLQEMFGQLDTPRVAGGRVPVLLHLLGPNYRPVQITSDLKNFWDSTYFQVRKDLRVHYPKHAWPDDPLTAPPQAKGRPRK